MKKGWILFIILILIGTLSFNFLFPSLSPDNISDNEHQKAFHSNFKSYSLVTPDSVGFAEEYISLFDEDIRERYDKEIHKNVYWQSNTIFYFKRANKYFPIIEPILAANNIPNDFKYLAIIESGLENVVSPAGATGFWQFMKETAKDYSLIVNEEVDERYHLEKSTEAACKYLQKAYDKFNNWTMAAAAYNLGVSGLQKRSEEQFTNNYYNLYLNTETSRYIFRLLAIKEIFENKNKYGFYIRNKDLYRYPDITTIEVKSSNINLSKYANELGVNYKILKNLNPWLRAKELTNEDGLTYKIKLPVSHEINIFNN